MEPTIYSVHYCKDCEWCNTNEIIKQLYCSAPILRLQFNRANNLRHCNMFIERKHQPENISRLKSVMIGPDITGLPVDLRIFVQPCDSPIYHAIFTHKEVAVSLESTPKILDSIASLSGLELRQVQSTFEYVRTHLTQLLELSNNRVKFDSIDEMVEYLS